MPTCCMCVYVRLSAEFNVDQIYHEEKPQFLATFCRRASSISIFCCCFIFLRRKLLHEIYFIDRFKVKQLILKSKLTSSRSYVHGFVVVLRVHQALWVSTDENANNFPCPTNSSFEIPSIIWTLDPLNYLLSDAAFSAAHHINSSSLFHPAINEINYISFFIFLLSNRIKLLLSSKTWLVSCVCCTHTHTTTVTFLTNVLKQKKEKTRALFANRF